MSTAAQPEVLVRTPEGDHESMVSKVNVETQNAVAQEANMPTGSEPLNLGKIGKDLSTLLPGEAQKFEKPAQVPSPVIINGKDAFKLVVHEPSGVEKLIGEVGAYLASVLKGGKAASIGDMKGDNALATNIDRAHEKAKEAGLAGAKLVEDEN